MNIADTIFEKRFIRGQCINVSRYVAVSINKTVNMSQLRHHANCMCHNVYQHIRLNETWKMSQSRFALDVQTNAYKWVYIRK